MLSKAFRYIIFIFFLLQFLIHSLFCQDSAYNHLLDSYDVKFYFLDLEVNNMSIDFTGVVTIHAEMVVPDSDSLALELIQEVPLDSIFLNDEKVSFVHTGDIILIALPYEYEINELIRLKLYYRFQNIETNRRLGIYNRQNKAGAWITYTLSEPYYSKTWFPCKQVLSDKADSTYVFLTMADSLKAGSNGILTDIISLGNGYKRYEWKSYYPVAYYLISFSIADYLDYSFMASTANGDSVLVQNYIYNDSNYFWENKKDVDATADLMEVYSELLDPYPFRLEKYGHCITPVGGGMEHQTMTTLGKFKFDLVAHELAHQWFGNYVTCADWQNIWINEGFASYAEFLAIERLKTKDEEINWLGFAHSLAMSSPEGSIYVPADELDNVSRIFDQSLSYRKGASIIHMIRHELGNDELFFETMRQFLEEYSDSVATAEDFKRTVELLSGRSFETFFQQWFYGAGHPVLDFSWEQRNDSIVIRVNQTTSTPEKTPFFNLLIDIKIEHLGGDTLVQFRQEEPSETFALPFNKRAFRITPDPDNWLLREISGIYRIIPDSSSNFHLFPNPAQNTVYIENYDIGHPFKVKIYNLNGVLLKEIEEKQVFAIIDLNDLSSGIYSVVVTTDEHKQFFQLVKL